MAPKWLVANLDVIERIFFAVFLLLFVYSLADWLGWSPLEPGFQPLRMVFLSAGLLVQSIASTFVRTRSRTVFFALLVTSLILIGLTFTVSR